MQRGLAAMQRLDDIFLQHPRIVDAPDAQPLPAPRGEIEFRGLGFSYNGVPVLAGVELRVPAGTTLAIVGPTGSGKTTLVSLIPRLFESTTGSVLVDGVEVTRYTITDLRRRIGL